MKKLLVFLAMSIFLVSCSTETKEKTSDINLDSNIKITATLPPLTSIAKYIWWENIEVNSIIQPGFSPHTFDLKPSHIKQISQADIVFATWLDIDNFIVENTKDNILELKNYVNLLEWHEHHHDHGGHEDEHHEDEHHKDEHHEDEHHEDENTIFYDPHFWLSLENGNKIAEIIKNKLIELDSKNTKIYEENYLSFIEESNKIKAEFSQDIEGKKIKHFVIFHEAYNYLFNEFGINEENVVVLEETAGREPSVGEMKAIIDTITQNNITVLYKEPQFESKIIEMLEQNNPELELNILDPLWQAVEKNSYFTNIETNLNNLIKIYE